MNFIEYLEKKKNIQVSLLEYLDYESNTEEKYQNLLNLFDDLNIQRDKHELK